jgi:ubiquinol-cytochrome c reductase cytochrome b subunit
MRLIRDVGEWFGERLQIGGPLKATLAHPVPRGSASWAYVFGSAALTVFGLQIVTGILLALIYVPSAGQAWASLQFLNNQVALGWFVRALHGWGSNAMVAIVLVHMAQVFLFGAHKYPRELTWVVGIFLLLCTFGMAFTGQVLRFDQDAYWGLGIGASIMSRVPVLGSVLVPMVLGGPIISGATLSRFFAIHVFVVPALLIAFVAMHLLLVLRLGVNEWPMPGRVVRRETYLREYHQLIARDGVPFVPNAIGKDIVFSGVVLLAIAACAYGLGPFGPSGQPDPTIIETSPRPDFFFLWLFALLSLLPPAAETPLLLLAPPIVILILLAVPFVAGQGEKSWRRRPVAVLTVLLAAVSLGTLTRLAVKSPWSPVMDAWSSAPVPRELLAGRTALERRGALVFQAKQCRNCHALGAGDGGGQRGPALDDVAVRLTRDQLVRQVVQGGGNMPAYGKNLSFAETNALVAFLATLHPKTERPARDASQSETRPAYSSHSDSARSR